ncbi:MAG TPA: hypothetical protein VJ010_03775 [Actinomycetota bacterium]|nr:hypothetical protein [Actinomycetota bacterium]
MIKHLLSIDQLSPSQIELVLKTADSGRFVNGILGRIAREAAAQV